MKNGIKNKLILVFSFVFLLLLTASGCGNSNNDINDISDEAPPTNDITSNDVDWDFYNQRAEVFVSAMATADFGSAVGMFDEAMTEALSAEDLQVIWESLLVEVGAFSYIFVIENEVEQEIFACFVTSHHENSGLTLRVVFSADGLIAGFSVDGFPALETAEIIETSRFTEYPIVIGEGTDWSLDGMLSMPDDWAVPVPAVVIVAGSGASDMDGRTGVSTPYRDIAAFLAANGIAVIRHDKRTYTHGLRMFEELGNSITAWEEAIEDAPLAAELLRNEPRIDPD